MPPIDWKTVTTTVVDGLILAILLAMPKVVARLGQVRRRRQLEDIAKVRSERVAIRVEGLHFLPPIPLQRWKARASAWEQDVPKHVGKFSKAETLRIRDLGPVPISGVPGVSDHEQLRLIRNVTETIKKLDELLRRNLPQR